MSDGTVVLLFFSSYAVTLVIGGLIGSRKGRTGAGVGWALLLGPIGWLIMVIVPDVRAACPACKGTLGEGAIKCMHCGSDVLPPVLAATDIVQQKSGNTYNKAIIITVTILALIFGILMVAAALLTPH